jgi:hypothetical protein
VSVHPHRVPLDWTACANPPWMRWLATSPLSTLAPSLRSISSTCRVRLPHGLAILSILKSLRTVPSLTSLTVPSAEEGNNVKVIEALHALPALKTLHLSLHDPRDSDLQAVSTLSSLTALNLVEPEDVSHQCAPPSSLTAKLLTLPRLVQLHAETDMTGGECGCRGFLHLGRLPALKELNLICYDRRGW